jgi:hypothetical protein
MIYYNSKLNPTSLMTNNGSGRFFVGQRSVGHISEALACAVAFGATAASLNWTYNTNGADVTDIALQQLPKAGFISDLESLDWENMNADEQFVETVFSICYFASKQDLPVLATCEQLVIPALFLAMASPQFDYDSFKKIPC